MSLLAIVGRLLDYPAPVPAAGLDELLAELDRLPPSPQHEAVRGFCDWLSGADALAVQASYVESFDLSKRSSLHLSFYAYGDRRQRGVAMLALKQRYARAGLELRDGELPDYLPAMCEFASVREEDGRELLAEHRPVIELIRSALHEAGSPYAPLLDALCWELGPLSEPERAEAVRLAREGPPDEQVGLEPFAPPESMPDPVRPAASSRPPCAEALGAAPPAPPEAVLEGMRR